MQGPRSSECALRKPCLEKVKYFKCSSASSCVQSSKSLNERQVQLFVILVYLREKSSSRLLGSDYNRIEEVEPSTPVLPQLAVKFPMPPSMIAQH